MIPDSRPKVRACRVLSAACTVLALPVGIYSMWLMGTHHKGYMADVFATFYGSIGLVLTLFLALGGIVLGSIWIQKNKAANQSSACSRRRTFVITALVTCCLLFFVALPWLLLFGDLS